MQTDYSSLLIMLALIALGFSARKTSLLQSAQINALPAILLNIAYPALIINSVTSVQIGSLVRESFAVVIVTFVITLLLFFGSIAILKKYENKDRKVLIVFNVSVGNIVYVALPVVRAVFGDNGVYFTMLHSSTQDIIIWTFYYMYFVGGGSIKGITVKKLISPCFISLIAAIVLAMFGIKPQGITSNLLQKLADLTVPLALIYIGGVLAGYNRVKDWIPDRDTIVISFVKVLAIPLIVYGLMQLVPVSHDVKLLLAVVFSAPATILSTVWAKYYKYDYDFSIKTLIFSTALFFIAASMMFLVINMNVL